MIHPILYSCTVGCLETSTLQVEAIIIFASRAQNSTALFAGLYNRTHPKPHISATKEHCILHHCLMPPAIVSLSASCCHVTITTSLSLSCLYHYQPLTNASKERVRMKVRIGVRVSWGSSYIHHRAPAANVGAEPDEDSDSLHVAAVKIPLLHLDGPDTAYPVLHVG